MYWYQPRPPRPLPDVFPRIRLMGHYHGRSCLIGDPSATGTPAVYCNIPASHRVELRCQRPTRCIRQWWASSTSDWDLNHDFDTFGDSTWKYKTRFKRSRFDLSISDSIRKRLKSPYHAWLLTQNRVHKSLKHFCFRCSWCQNCNVLIDWLTTTFSYIPDDYPYNECRKYIMCDYPWNNYSKVYRGTSNISILIVDFLYWFKIHLYIYFRETFGIWRQNGDLRRECESWFVIGPSLVHGWINNACRERTQNDCRPTYVSGTARGLACVWRLRSLSLGANQLRPSVCIGVSVSTAGRPTNQTAASAVRRLQSAVRTATPAFHVRSSGLFCGRPGGLELVTRLPARSVTFRWQFSPRRKNVPFSFYQRTQRIRGFVIRACLDQLLIAIRSLLIVCDQKKDWEQSAGLQLS